MLSRLKRVVLHPVRVELIRPNFDVQVAPNRNPRIPRIHLVKPPLRTRHVSNDTPTFGMNS